MKQLLVEANKMMKSLTKEKTGARGSSEGSKEQTLEALQRLLNDLKMNLLKMSQMTRDQEEGLIDSGATYPLRPV